MQSLVVFLAVAAVARASLLPLAQPPHHPAIVLDPHGRPLDTAEVIGARALHLQAKALEHVSPYAHSALAPAVVAAPAWGPYSAIASPLLAHSGLLGHGHLLKKRSLGLWGSAAYNTAVIAPASSSHSQSSLDIVHPSVYSHAVAPVLPHAVAAPVLSHAIAAPILPHAVAPVVAHAIAPAAVSHQSRVDVRTSPALAHSSGIYGHGIHGW